jgi:hypothetical protein
LLRAGKIRENPPMRLRPLSGYVHLALLFVCHLFLGTFVAVWATYQYEQSRWLSSLSAEQGRELLSFRESLLATQAPATSTPNALLRDLSRLESARDTATAAAQSILDLRIASDHALLAKLYRDAHDGSAAAAQAEAARDLLHQLGWRDSSDRALDDLATRRLGSIGNKGVR